MAVLSFSVPPYIVGLAAGSTVVGLIIAGVCCCCGRTPWASVYAWISVWLLVLFSVICATTTQCQENDTLNVLYKVGLGYGLLLYVFGVIESYHCWEARILRAGNFYSWRTAQEKLSELIKAFPYIHMAIDCREASDFPAEVHEEARVFCDCWRDNSGPPLQISDYLTLVTISKSVKYESEEAERYYATKFAEFTCKHEQKGFEKGATLIEPAMTREIVGTFYKMLVVPDGYEMGSWMTSKVLFWLLNMSALSWPWRMAVRNRITHQLFTVEKIISRNSCDYKADAYRAQMEFSRQRLLELCPRSINLTIIPEIIRNNRQQTYL